MKVGVIEVDHFQYGLTMSELFEGHEMIFFVTEKMENEMRAYNESLCKGTFHQITTVANFEKEITTICKNEQIDFLIINPIFDSFSSLLRIIQSLPCRKLITIHNWNYWLHPRWRSINGWREKKIKKQIVNSCDYIAVEDFMYFYLMQEAKEKRKLLNIPFTLFHQKDKVYSKPQDAPLHVVLPGSIHYERRRYEDVLEVIRRFALQRKKVVFSFAGPAVGTYGLSVIQELEEIKSICPEMVRFFDPELPLTPEMFRCEMEMADLVLSTSTTEFKAFGKTEYIGKTKPTAAIQDMLSYQLPGLLPIHLQVPKNLVGSCFNYSDGQSLASILTQLMDEPNLIDDWKVKAYTNSQHYTAKEIRKTLPFFNK